MTNRRCFIGRLAKLAGVSPKTIRYYEAIGLLPPAPRGANRYRLYPPETVGLLRFIARAKLLGLTLAQIKEIVGRSREGALPCAHVRSLLKQKVADLDRELADLAALRRRLTRLLADWERRGTRPGAPGVVCPHIEHAPLRGRGHDGS